MCCVSHSVVSDSCDSMDCSPPGSSVHGISQARILEWVAISFSKGSSQPRDWIYWTIQVSCTAGRFFTVWATREALYKCGLRDNRIPIFKYWKKNKNRHSMRPQEAEWRPAGGSDRKQVFNSKKLCNIWSCPAVGVPASRRRSPNRQNYQWAIPAEMKHWLGRLDDPFQP